MRVLYHPQQGISSIEGKAIPLSASINQASTFERIFLNNVAIGIWLSMHYNTIIYNNESKSPFINIYCHFASITILQVGAYYKLSIRHHKNYPQHRGCFINVNELRPDVTRAVRDKHDT